MTQPDMYDSYSSDLAANPPLRPITHDIQSLYDTIAILTWKLGGKATITTTERLRPPIATVTSLPNGNIEIEVEKDAPPAN